MIHQGTIPWAKEIFNRDLTKSDSILSGWKKRKMNTANSLLRKKILMTIHMQINLLQLQGQRNLLSDNSDELCDRSKIILQQGQGENDTNSIDSEIFATLRNCQN